MRFVDFYFDFSSTNSYFAALLLPEICARNDARVNWMPTHFAALFRGTGFNVMAMTPRKARYLWRDHERYAELTGLPFKRPSRFPIKTSSALRTVLAAGHLQAGCRR
jgi:2-hydroxychromene-2-carboxylate isomerase